MMISIDPKRLSAAKLASLINHQPDVGLQLLEGKYKLNGTLIEAMFRNIENLNIENKELKKLTAGQLYFCWRRMTEQQKAYMESNYNWNKLNDRAWYRLLVMGDDRLINICNFDKCNTEFFWGRVQGLGRLMLNDTIRTEHAKFLLKQK